MAVIKISRTVALDAPILTEALHGTLFTTEGSAHEFTIHCTQGGAAVTLSGTVTAKFIREETGDTILCAGSLSAGAAVVTLPADCYHRSGRFSMTVFVTSGSVATVVYACTGTVKAAEDGTLIDQGGVVPSIDQILQQLAGKVSKSGDTMTGDLTISKSIPALHLNGGSNTISILQLPNNRALSLRQYSPNGKIYQEYMVPAIEDSDVNASYTILTNKTPIIQQGTAVSSIPANGYQDIEVAFPRAFSALPRVQLTMQATNITVAVAFSLCAVVNSLSTTSMTIRAFNNSSSTRGPAIYWTATAAT